ncbi:MAG: type 4a pilus biogenesis protein PilO [Proteobacteria bacterium]|nr:type 4a pilus biogenesis protein PilO [Pseudomonadota bacterium]MBU4288063.1 type 4a pilus biogenesis protein PilO [Pseudomonadota bacterium]MBU4413812.1 type 4a pilus biogenesis protein PilO [Pseudomonadota bacterium]MCG2757476.1 type 4a pilus biogenesis protein PilO [Desulfobacteraceae bacterium]
MKKFDISLKAIEPLFEKVGNISKVHRILICVATFIVITGLFVYFLYLPKFENLEQLNSDYKNLEKSLVSAKKEAAQLNKYREKMETAEAQYKIAMKALPDKKEIPSLLTNISESGKEAGLEFLLFQPESEINKDFYAEIPVSIKVAGNYHNVGLFFDKVSRLSRIVNIKDIVMATPKEGDMLNTSCTAVTYRFVETEEKEKK